MRHSSPMICKNSSDMDELFGKVKFLGSVLYLGKNDWGESFLSCFDFAPAFLSPFWHVDSVAQKVLGFRSSWKAVCRGWEENLLGVPPALWHQHSLDPIPPCNTLVVLDLRPTSLSRIYQEDLNGILPPLQPSPCKAAPYSLPCLLRSLG